MHPRAASMQQPKDKTEFVLVRDSRCSSVRCTSAIFVRVAAREQDDRAKDREVEIV